MEKEKPVSGALRRLPRAAKASVAFFCASMVTKCISYVTLPIYTRLLTEEQYGTVQKYLTLLTILGVVAMFSLSQSYFNVGMSDFPEDRDAFSFSMLLLSNVITILFGAAAVALYPLVGVYMGIKLPFLLLMLAHFFTKPAYAFWTARQRYELKYRLSSVMAGVNCLVPQAVAVILVLITKGDRLDARIYGVELTTVLFCLGFYVYTVIKGAGKPVLRYWKTAFLFSLPLIPHYLSTYILSGSDKLMISYILGDSANAHYSVAYTISSILLIIWTAINSSFVPYTYEKCAERDFKAIARIANPILALFAAVSVIVTMLAPEIISILAPESYREAMYTVPPVMGGIFFQVHYYLYANVVYYFKKPRFVMYASVTATVLNLVLNAIFIPRYGYIAAAYTTLVCYFVQSVIDCFACRSAAGCRVYDMKAVGALSAPVILVSLFAGVTYENAYIRLGIVLLLLAAMLVKRKAIKRLLLEMLGKKKKGAETENTENKENDEKAES